MLSELADRALESSHGRRSRQTLSPPATPQLGAWASSPQIRSVANVAGWAERTRPVEVLQRTASACAGGSRRGAPDRRIVQLAQAGGNTQGDGADEVGVSQATVSNGVRFNGSEMGKGTRSDLRRSRTRR